MNKCFIMGKILTEPEFDFLYRNKKISISYFWIRIHDGNEIKILGYNEKADYIYRKIKKGEIVIVNGEIRVKDKIIEVEVDKIEKMRL